MCGIAGLVGTEKNAKQWVRRMLDAQVHRGPDGAGVWSAADTGDVNVVLGHRRLSILDLSEAGGQPMVDSSGRFTVTYNGEIYNYIEVRGELRQEGVTFRSGTDTEVLLEAYKHWGTDCLQRLNGMFAFALYDSARRTLFCARDRYGEKPFLYHMGSVGFAFASEYKALLQHPGIPLDIDEWRLIRAAHSPGTGLDADRPAVFQAVQQLRPGEAMEVDVDTFTARTWRYWEIKPSPLRENIKEDDVFAEFRDLLTDTVRLRLRSDVRVGSCLSGGLDSSAIVCLVRRLLGDDAPYNTFTGRFPGTAADEWRYAAQVIEKTGVISYVVEPTVDQFLDELPEFLWHNELPVGSASQYAQWCVFRLAKAHGVTVLLDGQGADEALGGYEQYFARYLEALRACGDTDRLLREEPQIRERYPLALSPAARALRDRLPFGVRHLLSNRLGMGTNLLYGLRPDTARQVAQQNVLLNERGFDPLANALRQDSFGRCLTMLLRYGDRNSMAHSREVRLPFCDHRIAEFVFRLPPHLIMGEVQTKRLLRESMRGILPEGIRTRWNKQGFRPPQDLWFESPRMLNRVREIFASSSFRQSPFWIPQWWDRALDRMAGGQRGLAWVVWQPFIIESWKEMFLRRLEVQRRQSQASVAP